MSNEDGITWQRVAELYPEFLQWAVQTYGPLPEECTEGHYTLLREKYLDRRRTMTTSGPPSPSVESAESIGSTATTEPSTAESYSQ